jgi:protein required for attachment to host cells
MTKHTYWVLVADGTRARAFEVKDQGRALETVWSEQPVGVNLASREIASDRPGRSFDSAGEGRHAMEPPTDPARYEKERFARHVVRRLDDDRKEGSFGRLIIVAAPQFLGDLRAAMPTPLAQRVETEIDKDLSKLSSKELAEHLTDIL